MAGSTTKKRSFGEGPKGRSARPTKKQRQIAAYHSSSEDSGSEDESAPIPANLLDSDDEDLDNVEVDDGASSAGSASDSDSDPGSDVEALSKRKSASIPQHKSKPESQTKPPVATDAPESDEEEDDENDAEDDFDDSDLDAASTTSSQPDARSTTTSTKSKRNDPAAFATSISKMLSSKLPLSRRADPIVSRSTSAAEQARQAVDAALEAKARKRLREQKRLASEKGRVRDVLVASNTTRRLNVVTGEIEEVADDVDLAGRGVEVTTGALLAAERRLRKVAQRGVVKLFNAVRAAQVKAVEAEKAARKEGIVGVKRKEEKVTEMSRKGFLDLIASGGGGLKKGGLEEA